jgi:hypothetical protein
MATGAENRAQVPLTTVVQVSVPGQTGKERREVVRDADAWRSVWAELRQGSALAEEPPAVDFEHEMVVLAAMETQSCVSRVTIRSVARRGDGVVVDLLERPPAPNCQCIVAERPIHVVRLRKMTGSVRFTAERSVMPCGRA